MIAPEKILKPEDVHSTHRVYDNGWFASDPRCEVCGVGVYDDSFKRLTVPCEGKQSSIFEILKDLTL